MDVRTVDHLLTTTRSARKRLDLARPIERDIIARCLEIAIQAPTGGNLARYHFVVVSDPVKRAGLADLYKKAFFGMYLERRKQQKSPFPETDARFLESATYLAEHLHEVPIHVVPCVEGRFETQPPFIQASMYGCILPMVWSLMLALRARGIGSSWTTLHLVHEKEAVTLLGIPDSVTQVALIPVAYFTGADFMPAKRVPAAERTHWDTWN